MNVLFCALALVLTPLAPPRDAPVKEPETGVMFPADQGDLALLGVGVREKYTVDVYAAGIYVHIEKSPWCKWEHPGLVWKSLVKERFPRRMTMVFVRDVGEDKLKDTFREVLRGNMSEQEFETEKDNIEALLDAYRGGVKENDTLTVQQAGAKVNILRDGKKIHQITSTVLMQAIWSCWFGKKPISQELKTGLIARYLLLKMRHCKREGQP